MADQSVDGTGVAQEHSPGDAFLRIRTDGVGGHMNVPFRELGGLA